MKDLFQDTQVICREADLGLLCGREIWQRQKRTAVHGQGPLDGTQEEHLTPNFLQENHLRISQKLKLTVLHTIYICVSWFGQYTKMCQSHLVSKWQVSKNRQIFSPLDRHKEESCRCLVYSLQTAGGVRGQTRVGGSPISLWIIGRHINILLHCTLQKERHTYLG